MTKPKMPMTHIEGADEQQPTDATQAQQPDATPAGAANDASQKAKKGASIHIDTSAPQDDPAYSQSGQKPAGQKPTQGIYAWCSKIAPGHEHALIGGVCGLVIALLIYVVGFWRTLFVCLLVFVGAAIGQYLDGDPKILSFIRRVIAAGGGDDQ